MCCHNGMMMSPRSTPPGTAPTLFSDVGLLTMLAVILGIFVATASVVICLLFPTRPDITEIRDLGILVGFEISALSFAIGALIRVAGKRPDDDLPFAL